jgi:uncharacterized protein (TIGR03067 family)
MWNCYFFVPHEGKEPFNSLAERSPLDQPLPASDNPAVRPALDKESQPMCCRTVYVLCAVLLAIVALGSDSPTEYDDRVKMDELEGTWQRTETEWYGQRQRFGLLSVETFHQGTYTEEGDYAPVRGNYRINTNCKPHHLDTFPSSGPHKGRTFKYIYEVDRGMLRTAIGPYGDERPKGFNDEGVIIRIYKRVK